MEKASLSRQRGQALKIAAWQGGAGQAEARAPEAAREVLGEALLSREEIEAAMERGTTGVSRAEREALADERRRQAAGAGGGGEGEGSSGGDEGSTQGLEPRNVCGKRARSSGKAGGGGLVAAGGGPSAA